MSTPATNHWQRWQPTVESPWDLRRVVHLHRRAGFGASWREIERDLKDGVHAAIDRVLKGAARIDGVPEGFEKLAAVIGDAAVASDNVNRLKAWWLFRMLCTPDPLAERLAILWHHHFATSNLKVNNPGAMRRQNEIFREFGRGPFGELLRRVAHDPALLVWLDAPANRKEHPNENLGREMMELFTLGVGHYTETDVKEAARAFTGWTVLGDKGFQEVADRHDDGEKTILGRTGHWRGDDLVNMLLDHPATARRLAMRLCEFFLGEEFNDPAAVQSLAEGLRERNLDIGWGVETILRSETFFAEANLRRRIAGPVEFVVGALRAFEQLEPPPSTLVLAEWTARLGQDLFYPPNVFGWPGGRSWITPRSMIGRANFAAALVRGGLGNRTEPLDVSAWLQRHGRQGTIEETITFSGDVLFGGPVPEPLREQLVVLGKSSKENESDTARRMVATIVSSPEFQVM